MRRLRVELVLACLVSLVASSPAHAYRMGEKAIDVKIDFDFTAGDQALPAGSYRVRHPTSNFSLIEIESAEGKKTVLLAISRLARPRTRGSPSRASCSRKWGTSMFSRRFGFRTWTAFACDTKEEHEHVIVDMKR